MAKAATKLEIKERPILFNGAMVRAILEGKKTQTRRVIKLPAAPNHLGYWEPTTVGGEGWKDSKGKSIAEFPAIWHTRTGKCIGCPYQVGGRLWVRETWKPYREDSAEQRNAIRKSIARIESGGSKDIVAEVSGWTMPNGERRILYAADFGDWAYDVDSDLKPWKPSIFMTRSDSRLLLEVVNVRIEHLQSLTEEDAIAEGMTPANGPTAREFLDGSPVQPAGKNMIKNAPYSLAYMRGWNQLNAKRGFGWDVNPWVFVISFRRVE